ncbi:lipopolysaccharide heptosyltransferase II [Limnohabitans sp.]|uniref:lipopolysaccharide heptosyltransferase II n=1 Tax=Limnohabitans sp. TaxID=1907725 RepID=UPI00286F973D|nr:lipopolysaccharide heptosyltransferase II [Limnohabitans sp.]
MTKNALIIAPQWIGDAVMTEPLLRRLAARGERLTVAALPWIAPVYRVMPGVVEVMEMPFKHGGLQLMGRWSLARQLRGKFDVAYVCPNSLKSALLPWLAGIPQRVGYTGEMRFGWLTDRLPNPQTEVRPPMVEWYAALSLVGQNPSKPMKLVGDLRPVLKAGVGVMDEALEALATHIPTPPTLAKHSYVVFAPGAEYGPAKRWPARHFAELAGKLDRPVVLLGSNKEFDICQEIATKANAQQPGHCFNLAGQTSLMQAFALIAYAHRVVSNDSGLMHVAAAFGVPQVAVFGSSSPEHTPPLNERARVVWLRVDPNYQPPLACAPCYERTCPLGHTRCLEDVSPERVYRLL